MKRRVVSLLLALCMGVLPALYAGAEELELFISTGEMVLDKDDQTDEEDILNDVNQGNASILEQLGQKDWTVLAAAVEKTGDWREDIVAVAKTQVGYTEAEDGMTLYTVWAEYEKPQPWTALFISWVAEQTGLSEDDFPRLHTYEEFTDRMRKIHALKKITRSSYPMPGDLALIEKEEQQLIGVVVYVSNGVASVITGGDQGAVVTELYSVGKTGFMQYIDLNELMARAGVETGLGGKVPVIPEEGMAAWTNTNGVYMRSEPTVAGERVTTVKKAGTALLVVSATKEKDGYIWYGVEYGSHAGYIRGDLLELEMAAIPAGTPAPTTKPAPTVTPEPTEVPGCPLCVSVADGVALPVECCYAHLAALGSEHANRFMQALAEADILAHQLYVNCHDAHAANGDPAIIPLGGLSQVDRAVRIDVKKAPAGEEITIEYVVYGASGYQWYQVETVEESVDGETVTKEVITLMEGENEAELTVQAKTGAAVSYFCVAVLPLQGREIELTGKRTMIAAEDAPIAAEAILGEEVTFTYEDAGAAAYRWFKRMPGAEAAEAVQSENPATADSGSFTTYAAVENAGAYYACEALDKDGNVLSVSGYFTYTVNLEDMCRYVEELMNMTRTERYEIMTGAWQEAGLAQLVTEHWKNGCDGKHYADYYRLLCCCTAPIENPFGAAHATYCGWYVAPETALTVIEYIPVGPDGLPLSEADKQQIGWVSLENETLSKTTGRADGSEAMLTDAAQYRFVGWYDNAECTGNPVSGDAAFVPVQPGLRVNDRGEVISWGEWPDAVAYYAKFDWNTGSLTIAKSGLRAGESAIFKVTATPADAHAAPQEYFIVLSGPEGSPAASATITNLLAHSSYTVTEQQDWAWASASDAAQTVTGTIAPGENVTESFSDEKVVRWLHDEAGVIHDFSKAAGLDADNEGGGQ